MKQFGQVINRYGTFESQEEEDQGFALVALILALPGSSKCNQGVCG